MPWLSSLNLTSTECIAMPSNSRGKPAKMFGRCYKARGLNLLLVTTVLDEPQYKSGVLDKLPIIENSWLAEIVAEKFDIYPCIVLTALMLFGRTLRRDWWLLRTNNQRLIHNLSYMITISFSSDIYYRRDRNLNKTCILRNSCPSCWMGFPPRRQIVPILGSWRVEALIFLSLAQREIILRKPIRLYLGRWNLNFP